MSAFVAVQDDGWTAPPAFTIDGIVYEPVLAYCYEAFDRPPMFELRYGECACSEYALEAWETCSGNEYRWVPGRADMPPLRFGGAA